jgi:hypothetical protein
MSALHQAKPKEEFEAWFNKDGQGWFKRELLHPRHRCDMDPFIHIGERTSRIVKRVKQEWVYTLSVSICFSH